MNEWKTKALRLFEVKQELEAECDRLKAENERLRKEIAALEETTEHCCKPAQEEVSRLWHENERLRTALEDKREVFLTNSEGQDE